ncbi:MAG: DNA-binding protein WhiA [Oscillospiraceae bacterium]|nr:DNA-binding protein WhiA [Oscillospiraceae bacterium]
MTFTQRVKANLAVSDFGSLDEKKSEVYAFLLFSSKVSEKEIILECDSAKIRDRFFELISSVFEIKGEKIEKSGKRKYLLEIKGESAGKIYREFFEDEISISEEKIESEKQFSSFLRGAYLASVNSSDPEKEYRLEFSIKSMPLCIAFMELLSERSVLLSFNQRNERFIAYTKDSSLIEDLFVLMGAGAASLEIMNAKIARDITNKINRVMNCDSANMRKTEQNAEKEIKAINYILEKEENILSDELLSVAKLRLQNPDSSLSELCSISETKISRSGMYHRLKKIVALADELYKKEANR